MAVKARLAASLASAQIQNIMAPPAAPQTTATAQLNMRNAEPAMTPEERERSLNIIIDAEGRTIDKRTGEVVQLQSRVPTLKANIKAQKRDYKTALGGNDQIASGLRSTILSGISTSFSEVNNNQEQVSQKPDGTESEMSERFFDPRVKLKTAERNKRKLVFNEKGKFEEIANKLRTKTKLQILQQEITSISKKTGISAESKLALIQPKRTQVRF
jgi:U4/U6 small nuclear ribonucleoprotein PRP3